MDRRDRLFRFYRRNPTTGAQDIYKAQRHRVVWPQRKAKMEFFFIHYYARNHILLTSGTHSSSLLLPQVPLKIGQPLIQITHHSLPTFSTYNTPLSAPPPSALTISHHPPHLLIPHLPSPCIQQLLTSSRKLLLPSNQTALLGPTTYLLLPLLLATLSSPIHCVPLSTPPLLVLFSGPLGSVPLSNFFKKVRLCLTHELLSRLFSHGSQQSFREECSCPVLKTSPHPHLLYPFQSEFRPFHSTQILLHCLYKWYKAFDTTKYVRAVFLDIS